MYSQEIKIEQEESGAILNIQEPNPEPVLRKVKTELVEEEEDVKSQLATTTTTTNAPKRSTRLAVKSNKILKSEKPKFKVTKRRGRPPKNQRGRPQNLTVAKRKGRPPKPIITASEETAPPKRKVTFTKPITKEEIIAKIKERPPKSILKKPQGFCISTSTSSSSSSTTFVERKAKRIITPSAKLIEQIEDEEKYIRFITEMYTHYCVMCDHPITTQANYEQHMMEVHNTTTLLPPDPYSDSLCCALCTTTFPTKHIYQEHLRESHNIERRTPPPPSKVKKRRKAVSKPPRTSISPPAISPPAISPPAISPPPPPTSISPPPRTLIPQIPTTADINNADYYCGQCEFTYSSVHHFKTHLRRIHKFKNCYSARLKHDIIYSDLLPSSVGNTDCYCKVCQMNFPSNLVYRLHLREVHDLRNITVNQVKSRLNYDFKCNTCDKYFLNKTSFLSHMSKVHLSASFDLHWPKDCIDEHLDYKFNMNLYCSLCSRFYLTPQKFTNHIKVDHKILYNTKDFATTEKESIPDIYDPFSYCKVCQTTFSSRIIYLTHLDTKHSINKETGNIKRYCSTCDITFSSSNMLINHLRRHPYKRRITGNTKDTFIKEEQELLLQSLFPSVFDPNFYCRPCDTTFESHLIFKYHLNTQHYISLEQQKSKERLYHCTLCQRSFMCEQYFINHNSNIHGITSKMSKKMIAQHTTSSSEIICTLCNKASYSQKQYARHFKIAHDSKFSVCKTCELTFIPTKQSIQYNAAKKGCKAHSHGIPTFNNKPEEEECIITNIL